MGETARHYNFENSPTTSSAGRTDFCGWLTSKERPRTVRANACFEPLTAKKDNIVIRENIYHINEDAQCEIQVSVMQPEGEAISVEDMVNNITRVFDVKITHLAKILGVSRGSVYNHVSGKEIPADIEIYQRLDNLAGRVSRQCNIEHIRNGLKSVLVSGRTLLYHLQHEKDEEGIFRVCKIVENKVAEREPSKQLPTEEIRRSARRFSKQG